MTKRFTQLLLCAVLLLTLLPTSTPVAKADMNSPFLPVEQLGTIAGWTSPQWRRDVIPDYIYNATTNRLVHTAYNRIELINPDTLERGPSSTLSAGSQDIWVDTLAIDEQTGHILAIALVNTPASTQQVAYLFTLDGMSLQILHQIQLEGGLAYKNYHALYASQPAPRLYLYNADATATQPSITIFDTANGKKIGVTNIGTATSKGANSAMTAINNQLFVGLQDRIDIFQMNATGLTPLAEIMQPGKMPVYFANDPPHNRIIVVQMQSVSGVGYVFSLQTLDLATRQLGAPVSLPAAVNDMEGYSISSNRLYLLTGTSINYTTGEALLIYDLENFNLLTNTEVGHIVFPQKQKLALASHGTRLLVIADDNTIPVLDPATGNQIDLLVLIPDVRSMAYNPQDGNLYTSIYNGDRVVVFNPNTKQQHTVTVGHGPGEVQVNRSNGSVIVFNRISGTLSVIQSGATTATELRFPEGAVRYFGIDANLNRIYIRVGNNLLLALDGTTLKEVQRTTVTEAEYSDSMVVNDVTHRLYLQRVNSGSRPDIYDGQTLTRIGELDFYANSVVFSLDGRRMYVNLACLKACGGPFVVDLMTNQVVANLQDVSSIRLVSSTHAYGIAGGTAALNPIYDSSLNILDTQTFAWVNTGITAALLALVPGSNRLYSFSAANGSFSRITDNLVLSNPTNANNMLAKIEILWPHNDAGQQAPTQTATKANLLISLFQPGGFVSASCDFDKQVQVWASRSNEPGYLVGTATRTITGKHPAWVLNDVDVRWANDPDHKMFFWITVDGASVNTSIWAHAINPLTNLPQPLVPDHIAGTSPSAVDARINIVWPHDAAGNLKSVTDADFANIGVALYQAGSHTSVGTDWSSPVRLYSVLNNGTAQLVGTGTKRLVTQNGITYPVWDFNDVDVRPTRDPHNKYYFFALTDGLTYPTIWVHGADGRTLLPQPDQVFGGCQ